MFKQQCYIRKNTHELKNKLRLMGYNVSDSLNLMGDYIKCSNGSAECILKPSEFKEKEELDRYIDCCHIASICYYYLFHLLLYPI